MRLPGWLAALFGRPRDPARDSVAFDHASVTCRHADGTTEAAAWEGVHLVEIRTTDHGPFVEDVFLVVHSGDARLVVPQGADGFGALLEHLQGWPGFDNGAVVAAMTCTEDASFICWRRGETADPEREG